MKRKIIICSFFLILFILVSHIVLAKYVINESMIVAVIQVDRTPPSLQVSYSTKEITSGKVEVTIKAVEEMQEIEGWSLQEDKKTLKKEYLDNTKEKIEVKDLAGNVTQTIIEINNIDKEEPRVVITKIENSNSAYPNYANKEAEIVFTIVISDDRNIVKSLEENDMRLFVDEKEIMPKSKIVELQKDTITEKIILLKITGIEEEGILTLKIPEGVVKDEVNHCNIAVEKNTNIQIDNTKPQVTYSQNKAEEGKIEASISANEEIRKLDGWELENKTILRKVFNNNLSYTTTVQDLAGNSSDVEINVVEATNVILSYASHNSMVGWSYGYGNYDIAGLEAIQKNPKYKTESLAFTIFGNVEKDYLQARVYVYTHWGEGSQAQCENTGKIYSYGWNPSNTTWKYENEETKVNLNGRTYFQLGGAGVNGEYRTDINGNGMITPDITVQFRYGISALQLKLKSYEENAICYQIYIDSIGWIKPVKNGEVTCYQQTKPISAIRVALVPNSEVNALMNTWNQDTGKTIN